MLIHLDETGVIITGNVQYQLACFAVQLNAFYVNGTSCNNIVHLILNYIRWIRLAEFERDVNGRVDEHVDARVKCLSMRISPVFRRRL